MEVCLEDWIKDIKLEDLPNEDMKLVAENISLEFAVKLMLEMPGIRISVPKTGFNNIIKDYIRKNYTGLNARRLALKLKVSETFIYNALKNPKQIDDFEQMELEI